MVIKQNLFLILLFSFPFHIQSSIDSSKYHQEALEWANLHIQKEGNLLVSSQELQILANLFYFSYQRSATTLAAQQAARLMLDGMWHGWQNIAHTRMNPSLKPPYVIDYDEQERRYRLFLEAQKTHRSIGLTYSHIAQAAVKEHYLSKELEHAVINLREHARTIVAQAFLNAKKVVGELYHVASQGLRSPDDQTRFDVLDTVSYYLPILSMQTFIDAEKAQLKASEQSWQIINTMINVNMTIWDTIETERGSFYCAYYMVIMEIMRAHKLDKSCGTIIVDENGMNKQYKKLPFTLS